MTIITYDILFPLIFFLIIVWAVAPLIMKLWAFLIPYFRSDARKALDARADLHARETVDHLQEEVATERLRHTLRTLPFRPQPSDPDQVDTFVAHRDISLNSPQPKKESE